MIFQDRFGPNYLRLKIIQHSIQGQKSSQVCKLRDNIKYTVGIVKSD